MARRPKGTGSVTHVGGKRWRIRASLGTDPVTGKRRQIEREVIADNKTAATRKLDALRAEFETVKVGSDSPLRTVVAEFIRHSEARGRAPRTIESAKASLENVIGPALGDIPVADLGTYQIETLYRQLATGEGRGRALSPASIRRHHAVLSAALSQAVRWRWIPENPAALVALPGLERRSITVPTAVEVAALLRAADALSARWGTLIRLAILTGARRGELAGLQWHDVDEGPHARLLIRRSVYRIGRESSVKGPKGGRERFVAIGPGLALVLDSWRHECRSRADDAGVEIPPEGFIVSPMPDGSQPVNVDTFTATVSRLAGDLDMPHIHLHSLRHLAATEMLAAGVSPSDAAALLGHADGGRLALQVYSHATDDRQRAAAAVLEKSLVTDSI